MNVDYDESLRWLRTLPDFERTGDFAERPDLVPMRALLTELGEPHRGRATVHIAGSKGKGSTGVMVEAVLRTAGMRTGYYISPHLHRYNERIRIDAAPASHEAFAAAMSTVRDAIERVAPAYPDRQFLAFDALTAGAFVAFREAGVAAQVIEVGLGGRLDSTNVFHQDSGAAGDPPPHVVVLTAISLEHTAILGETIAAIAGEKAGIITEGATVVVAPQRESALDVFRETASRLGATLIEVASSCQLARISANADGQQFKLRTPRATYTATLPLTGRHQLDNAATAVLSCEQVTALTGIEMTPQHVSAGLAAVSWPGRLEVLTRKPLVIIDGAHNADSAKRMVAALSEHFGLTRATFLFGTLSDKDATAMAGAVAPMADAVFVAGWSSPRAADPHDLAGAFRPHDVPVSTFGSVAAAYEAAAAHAGDRGALVAFGSLAFVAAVREHVLGIESDAFRLADRERA